MKKQKLAIISCGKNKYSGTYEAQKLYKGTTFKMKLAHARRRFDDFYILSAKYGLIKKDQLISDYDLKIDELNKEQLADWTRMVIIQFATLIDPDSIIEFHTPDGYWKPIINSLKGFDFRFPVKGLSQGFHRQYYKEQREKRQTKLL